MNVVDLFLGSLVSCRRIMLGLLCRASMTSMRLGRPQLMCPMFQVMMWALVRRIFVDCDCGPGLCVWFWMEVKLVTWRVRLASMWRSCLGMRGRCCSRFLLGNGFSLSNFLVDVVMIGF